MPDGTVVPAPMIVSAASETSGLSTAYAPTTESCTLPPCETRAPVVQHRAVELGARLDDRGRARAPTRARARRLRCARPSPISTGASTSRVGLDRRVALHPDAGRDLARAGRGRVRQPAGQRVGVGLEVLLGRPDVEPVRVALVAEQQPGLGEHARERLALDRHVEAGRDALAGTTARARRCRR